MARPYSNVSRGKRKETEVDGVPCISQSPVFDLEVDKSSQEYRKNRARLIQKLEPVPDWIGEG